jgi:hypothetical protein
MGIKGRAPSLGEVAPNGRATDRLIAAVVIDDHLAIRFPLALLDYGCLVVAISVTMILADGHPSSNWANSDADTDIFRACGHCGGA